MRKGEKGNPFNIKVGISIVFLIRTTGIQDRRNQEKFDAEIKNWNVNYRDINYFDVIEKYRDLSKPFDRKNFLPVPKTPDFFFIPKDIQKENHYFNLIPITDLFIAEPKSGIMTGRDALVSNIDEDLLKENIELFFSGDFKALAELGVKIRKTKNWDPDRALKKSNRKLAVSRIIKYNYRGMDERFLIYDNALVEGPRFGYLDLISIDNPAISVTRSLRTDHFSHALITALPPEKCFLAVKDSSYVFPLKLKDQGTKFNLKIPLIGFKPDPGSLFYYIYGILNCSIYRKKYDPQLKRQFPRIPFPKTSDSNRNHDIFIEMSKAGKKLAELHLKKSSLIDISKFNAGKSGDLNIIEPFYSEKDKKIFFNKKDREKVNNTAWIGGITTEMWKFEIGSIPQLKQWLNARKYINPEIEKPRIKQKRHKGLRRPLNIQELNEFLILCSVVKNTLEIIPELDKIYEKID